jgi:ATP-dependent DNA ligase
LPPPALYPAMFGMRIRTLPAGFIEPCLPTKASTPPSGGLWVHEIKHDGFRMMVRRDAAGVRLLTRRGEGIVSKRKGSPYRSGRSPDWLKMKNPDAAAVKREAERL